MKKGASILLLLAVTTAFIALFAWPLPRHAGEAISAYSDGGETHPLRTMEVGDHLQLHYWFAMVHDFVTTDTPWFHNRYEFNTDNSADGESTRAFFLPMSLIYTLGAMIGGAAFGYNLTLWIALALNLFFTAKLTHRLCENRVAGWGAALLALTFPYQWETLLGGSPSGFVMWTIPAVWLGIDMWIRNHRGAGSALAGFAILTALCNDLHAFYFAGLLTPFWVVLALIRRGAKLDLKGNLLLWIRSSLGLIGFGLCVVAYLYIKTKTIADTQMSGGFDKHELHLHSPYWRNFFDQSSRFYVGWILIIPCILATLTLGWLGLKKRMPRHLALVGILCFLVIGGLIAIGWGLRGPFGIHPIMFCRSVIPKFDSIRQPAKTLLALAPFAAVLLAITFAQLARITDRKSVAAMLPVAMVLLGLHYSRPFNPTLCRLDSEQAAYAAASEVLQATYTDPADPGRALAIPLWPGDSTWNAVDEHYALIHHVRMINGYSPAIRKSYRGDIFIPYSPLNMGWAPDALLDSLLDRNAGVLLFHENAHYQQKWSAHPPAYTFEALRNHPRLEPITRERSVWAYRILPGPATTPQQLPTSRPWLGNRWRAATNKCRIKGPAKIVAGTPPLTCEKIVSLPQPEAEWIFPWTSVSPVGPAEWIVRVRGTGTVHVQALNQTQTEAPEPTVLQISDPQWHWLRIPATIDVPTRVGLSLTLEAGHIDIDQAFWTAGPVPQPAVDEAFTWPATHANFDGWRTDDEHVFFDKDRTRPTRCWWLPWWPLEAGTYSLTATAKIGETVSDKWKPSSLYVSLNSREVLDDVPLVNGTNAPLVFTLPEAAPIEVAINFTKAADVTLEGITLRRLPTPAPARPADASAASPAPAPEPVPTR